MEPGERTFSQVVKEYLVDMFDAKPLVARFEMNVSTVRGWAIGIDLPPVSIQEQVIRWIADDLHNL